MEQWNQTAIIAENLSSNPLNIALVRHSVPGLEFDFIMIK